MISEADKAAARLAALLLETDEIEFDMIDKKIDQMGLRLSAIVRTYGVQQYKKGYKEGMLEKRSKSLDIACKEKNVIYIKERKANK